MERVGKYEIREQIGRGGMGAVYRAYDPVMEREVAIKVILDIALDVPEIKERFYREARTAGKLTHENITVIHDVGEEQGRPYIVMEYLSGTDLRTMLERRAVMTLERQISIAAQICRGLAYSHGKDIIHRDVKPANIRVLENGRVKIMDFGIARLGSSALTSTGTILGTPYYMSPEQIQGKKVDRRSDIFSCGVVLYELFTSRKPFPGDEPTSVMYKIVHEIPEGFEELERLFPPALPAILGRMLQKDPAERYQSMDAVVEAFEDLSEVLKEERQSRASRRDSAKPGTEKNLQRDRLHEASTIAAGETPRPAAVPAKGPSTGDTPLPDAGPKRPLLRRLGKPGLAGGVLGGIIALAVALYLLMSSTPPNGTVILNILPWAHVTGIEQEGAGPVSLPDSLTTPCRFTLAPGTYVLTCANPGFVKTFRVRVVVAQDSLSQVTQTFPGYTIERVLARY